MIDLILAKRRIIVRSVAVGIGVAAVIWTLITPDPGDLNTVLLLLWTLIAAHGLFMSLLTLRRVTSERYRARSDGDEELVLIANGNVRRNLILAAKLVAFLIIGVSVLFGHNNVTMNRALVVVVLMLMSGGAALDADEIDEFDRLNNHRPLHLVDRDKEFET